VRDFGALKESAALYASAVEACPENHNYCLNYVHVLENLAAYQQAFDVLLGYFERHASFECISGGLKVPCFIPFEPFLLTQYSQYAHNTDNTHTIRTQYSHNTHTILTIRTPALHQCSMIVDVLKQSGLATAGLKAYASSAQPPTYELQYIEKDIAEGQSGSSAHVKINLGGGESVLSKGGSTETYIRAKTIAEEEEGEEEEEVTDILSPEAQKATDDHDMLALFFTLVKVLYSSGCLGVLPSLIRLIEPARRGRDLGQTLVRNEHAYYVCIAQLLCLHPDRRTFADVSALLVHPGAASAAAAPLSMTCSASASAAAASVPDCLYVCGDSHSLCPAWRTLCIHGKKVLLHSALVTGLKHWHLRPSSRFYPKANFYEVVSKIPSGASIVMLFGEIDCREGILLAGEQQPDTNQHEQTRTNMT
jgi:hypothetical protein